MSGIVRRGMLAGLGQGLAALGPMLAREQEAEEARASRLELAKQQAADRMEQQREKLEWEREKAAMRAAGANNGGGGGGGMSTLPQPGSPLYEAQMLRMAEGMGNGDVPTGEAVTNAIRTGDRSAFEQDLTGNYDAKDFRNGNPTRGVSAETDALLKKKTAVLRQIREEEGHGKNYKEVTEGRLNTQRQGMVDEVIKDKTLAPAEKLAVGDKQKLYDDGPSGITGNFKISETPTARSRAESNQANAAAGESAADARKANADAGKAKGDRMDAEITRLSGVLEKLAGRLTERGLDPVGVEEIKRQIKTNQERLTTLQARQKEELETAGKPTGTPAPTAAPGKVVPKLPPGAKQIGTHGGKPVYQTPDGRKFIGA